MGIQTGKDGLVSFDASTVGETKGWSITENVEVKDGTAQRDATRKKIAGFEGFTGNLECHFDKDDAPQNGVSAGDVVAAIFYPYGNTTGLPEWTASILITEVVSVVNFDDIMSVTFNFESNGGALAKATVS